MTVGVVDSGGGTKIVAIMQRRWPNRPVGADVLALRGRYSRRDLSQGGSY